MADQQELDALNRRIAADLLMALIENKQISLAPAPDPKFVVPALVQAYSEILRGIEADKLP